MDFADVLSMIGSLVLIVLVLVLTYYATRFYARKMGSTGSGRHIKIVDKTVLGSGAALTIVQIGDRYYLLGVSDKNIQLISELPEFDQHMNEAAPVAAPFSQVLRDLMDKARTKPQNKDDGDAT